MTYFEQTIENAKKYFPKLEVKYKDENSLMKLIGYILFFNKTFMRFFFTTLGNTVYVPSRNFVETKQISALVSLLHEFVHVYDANRLTIPLFSFLYASPQILSLFCLPLFLISWKLALPLMILFLSPLPSYFRMYFEKRGYLVSMYVLHRISGKFNYKPFLRTQALFFISEFHNSDYYFMWNFKDINVAFEEAIVKIENNQHPYDDPKLFAILDKIIDDINNS
jgi:hypothetical protein